ncbi:TRAP transporter small permease [Azospirillum halopraeferens]|uniref:TRAP transporter small permease n=1 Tax=Azospirillum halopraeferens TaxID=34010 RepID=UPI00040D65A8|nr:TRAP transporter small permease [Azospirillum halopraeferens]
MTAAYRWLCRIEATVAGTFLVLMVAMIFLGGVARLLHTPMNWTMDVATCLFAWACFLSADVAWRKDGLMAIDLVSGRLPAGAQRRLALVNLGLIAAFLVFLIGAGLWMSYVGRARSFQGIPGVSYSWVTMSLPVGAALLLITTALKARRLLREPPDAAPAGDTATKGARC